MIKPTQIFKWEDEPAEERPSEFRSTSTHATLSGYHPLNDPLRARHAAPRVGFKSLLAVCGVLLALGAYALSRLAPLLHG